jgi:hypothetical protein
MVHVLADMLTMQCKHQYEACLIRQLVRCHARWHRTGMQAHNATLHPCGQLHMW